MMFIKKYSYLFLSFLLFSIAIKIIYTKEIKQGNSSMGNEVLYLGNYAYLVGLIFIYFAFISFKVFKKNSMGKEE